jgi:uncharacterized protein
MTPQERDLTTILLDRVKKTEGEKDPEAVALIRQMTDEQYDAPYYLVQTALIQDLSLHNAQSRITDLETLLTETKPTTSSPPSSLGAPSFLGAVFGGSEPSHGVRPNNAPARSLATSPHPIAAMQQPSYVPKRDDAAPLAPGAGLTGDGGFLRSAAGIVGGTLAFEGVQSMFGQHDAATIVGNQTALPSLAESFLNNHYGAESGASFLSTDEEAGVGCDPELPDPRTGSG